MTLLLTESFEFVSSTGGGLSSGGGVPPADKWNLSNNLSVWTSANARTGSCNADGSTSGHCKHQVQAANEHATFIVGVAVMASFVHPGLPLINFYSDAGATLHGSLRPGSVDGTKLEYVRGDGVVLGSSATGVLPGVGASHTYRYVEAKVTLSDSVGAVTFRVDEMAVLSLSGVDTKNGGTKTVFDSFSIQGATADYFYDDIYLCNGAGSVNNDFLGAVRIEALGPNGNGTSSGMTSGGTPGGTGNYAFVDDPLPGAAVTTDYVDGINTGDKDTYNFTNSARPGTDSVKGVMVYNWAQKTDAGARALSLVARSGGVESTVAAGSALVNGVYGLKWACFETKPGGGVWTMADVSAAEFGQVAT